MNRLDAFYQINWNDYENKQRETLRAEVHALSKEYILSIEEDLFKKYLTDKYTLEQLEIQRDTEQIHEPRIAKESKPSNFGGIIIREVYIFTVSYRFTGSLALFAVTPNPCTMCTHEIIVNPGKVSFELKVHDKKAEEFNRKKEEAFSSSFINVGNINQNVRQWNSSLERLVDNTFDQRKKHFIDENNFFKAINISADPKTSGVFTAPTIKRQIIPPPKLPEKAQFSSVPTMADEMYEDVLKVLYQVGRSIEQKPSLYREKHEPDLRDQFLLFLETRYKSSTGTGETFNKKGKTDILLKYEDGTNLFVAECKFWAGETQFHEAINQLFDRYLTWRDSKAALLLFVENKSFSTIIEKVKTEATQHRYFVRTCSHRDTTSLAFEFHFPDDSKKIVQFAVLLFHFPTLQETAS